MLCLLFQIWYSFFPLLISSSLANLQGWLNASYIISLPFASAGIKEGNSQNGMLFGGIRLLCTEIKEIIEVRFFFRILYVLKNFFPL